MREEGRRGRGSVTGNALRGKQTDPSLVELIRELVSTLEDAEIARILKVKDIGNARGLKWTESRVRTFRRTHHLRTGPAQNRDEYLTGDRAMEYLGVSRAVRSARTRSPTSHRGGSRRPNSIPMRYKG